MKGFHSVRSEEFRDVLLLLNLLDCSYQQFRLERGHGHSFQQGLHSVARLRLVDHVPDVWDLPRVRCHDHGPQPSDQFLVPRDQSLPEDDHGVAFHDVLYDVLAHRPEALAVPVCCKDPFEPLAGCVVLAEIVVNDLVEV